MSGQAKSRTALIESALRAYLAEGGRRAGPSDVGYPGTSGVTTSMDGAREVRAEIYPNGDEALIAERMRRLAPLIPLTSRRRQQAVRELTQEGKLHA